MTLVSVAPLSGHSKDAGPFASAETRAQVTEFYATWTAAFESRDLAKLMKLYHPSTRYNAQGEPDKGLDQLRATWVEELKKPQDGMTWRPRIERIYEDDSLVVVVAFWDATLKSHQGTVVSHTIRSMDVLTRSPKGLLVLHTLNYPEL